MKLNEIQSLIKFVAKSGVNEVELETKDFKIQIKAQGEPAPVQQTIQATVPVAQPIAPVAAPAPQAAPMPAVAPAAPAAATVENDNYVTIKSPMVGTFYRSANPESDAFVSIGDSIDGSSVVCIIEAMKLFNEIEAEVSGTIVKVLVDDATPVEYDTPLFLVDPS